MQKSINTICSYLLVTICGCFVITANTCPVAMARGPRNPENNLPGVFYGTALEGGNINKIETKIAFDWSHGGKLAGEYTLHQPHGKESIPGRLTELQSWKDHHVIFKWKDNTGTGTVDMIFDNTGSAFKGRWSTDDGSVKQSPWNGHKLHSSENWTGIKLP